MRWTPEYKAWCRMIGCCENPKDHKYYAYGGRGIGVAKIFRENFLAFLSEVGKRPSNKHSLGRIDNNKGYEPGNLEWQTIQQQNLNTRANRFVLFEGKTYAISQLAKLLKLSHSRVTYKVNKGYLKEVFKILLILLMVSSHVHAQSNVGQDFLAAQQGRFDTKRAAKYSSGSEALGSLDYTFGSDLGPIRSLLSNGSYAIYRFHIINSVCVRNGNCGRYEIGYGYTVSSFNRAVETKNPKIIRFLRQRTALYKQLAQEFPGVKFWESPALEHNLSNRAYRVLADEVKNVWPEVQLVNAALNCQGERYRGALRECHGNTAAGDIVSLDGIDVTDIDVVEWLKKTREKRLRFVWSRSYNCRTQGTFVDPRQRTACPKEYQFEELAHITDTRIGRPENVGPTVNCEPFVSPYIYKQFSEDKGTGDPRANLPVLLLPGKSSAFKIISHLGTELGVLSYFGVYSGDTRLNRYYSGHSGGSRENGYTWEKEGISVGSPWVYVKQGSKCYGPFVPGRRAGRMRD